MFNVGPEKLMVVLLVALIVLGPDKLPNAARQIGRYLNEFRRISEGFRQELRSAIDMAADPVTSFTQTTTGAPTPDTPTASETATLPGDAVPGDGETPTDVAAATDAEAPSHPAVSEVVDPTPASTIEPIAEPDRTASA